MGVLEEDGWMDGSTVGGTRYLVLLNLVPRVPTTHRGTQVSVDLVLVARSCSRLRGRQKPYNVIKIVESCLHHCIGTELKIVEAAIPGQSCRNELPWRQGDHGYHYSV